MLIFKQKSTWLNYKIFHKAMFQCQENKLTLWAIPPLRRIDFFLCPFRIFKNIHDTWFFFFSFSIYSLAIGCHFRYNDNMWVCNTVNCLEGKHCLLNKIVAELQSQWHEYMLSSAVEFLLRIRMTIPIVQI